MTIEILYFEGCPHYQHLPARIGELLARNGLEATITLRRVRSDRDAHERRFLGSPTVRVDGRDVEPGAADRTDYGLKCRLYRDGGAVSTQPADEWILAAVRRA